MRRCGSVPIFICCCPQVSFGYAQLTKSASKAAAVADAGGSDGAEPGLPSALPSGRMLFKNVNFGVDLDTRVGIVGPNGAGKEPLIPKSRWFFKAVDVAEYYLLFVVVGKPVPFRYLAPLARGTLCCIDENVFFLVSFFLRGDVLIALRRTHPQIMCSYVGLRHRQHFNASSSIFPF
jgi:hypothetical protein